MSMLNKSSLYNKNPLYCPSKVPTLYKLQLIRENSLESAFLCLTPLPEKPLPEKKLKLLLHPTEIDKWNKIPSPLRKKQFLLGRLAAKHALGHKTNTTALYSMAIFSGVFGQPYLSARNCSQAQITISHTNDYGAAIAFPEAYKISIDIEHWNINREHSIKSQMTQNELLLVKNIPEKFQYTFAWTVKEALSKVIHVGLMTPFELFEITSIQFEDPFWISLCSNFGQYKILSTVLDTLILSIAIPKKTTISIEALENHLTYV